jgi:hypothetical protein
MACSIRARASARASGHAGIGPRESACIRPGRRASVRARPPAQVTMKLQLVYEEPYAGYPDAELVKSPSPVPRTVRGGVDLSVFNSGSASIKARAGAREAACLRAPRGRTRCAADAGPAASRGAVA